MSATRTLSQTLKACRAGRALKLAKPYKIFTADPVIIQKSTFQGHVASVSSHEDLMSVMDTLYSNPKIVKATHNMFAFHLKKGGETHYDDDGETGAGQHILRTLTGFDCDDVVVIVSRWYGGVHLGPSRFRVIAQCAADALSQAGYQKKTGEKDAEEEDFEDDR